MSAILDRVDVAGTGGAHATLYLGDCYEIMPALVAGDDWQADETDCVADPPYLIETSGGGKYRKKRKMLDEIADQDLDRGFDLSILDDAAGAPWCRAAFIFCHNDQLAEVLPGLAARFGRCVVLQWFKTNAQPVANNHYQPDCEPYVHAWNAGGHPVGALRDKKRRVDGPCGENQFDHPTQKPLYVMRKILRNSSAPVIVDPFMGTGSTGMAAFETRRRFIGIEKNPKHFATAVKRLKDLARWREPAADIKAPGKDEPAIKGRQGALI